LVGTGLCSYRVRGVDGSCAKHLAVESYTSIMLPTFKLIIVSIPSPTHSFIPGLKLSFSANPSLRSLRSLSSSVLSPRIPRTSEHFRFYFSFFSVFHFSVVGSVRWIKLTHVRAFGRTLKRHLVSYRIVSYQHNGYRPVGSK